MLDVSDCLLFFRRVSTCSHVFLLAPDALTLVFVETKRGAADLAYYLNRQGYHVVAIHGDLKQFERERHLESFRNGQTPILVATAVSYASLCSTMT